jgi:uncharacterized protein (TIGR02147 family)
MNNTLPNSSYKNKQSKLSVIDIFKYLDYRDFLHDFCNNLKRSQKGFSYRSFAKLAAIPSPNYLFRVIKGSRNLTDNYCPNICAALSLKPDEDRYFKALVKFNNEKMPERKEEFLRQLLMIRHTRGEFRLQDKKLKFFSKWYYPIVRELVVVLDFKDDCNLLARNCVPRITAVQAHNAVRYLLANGFIGKDEYGKYFQTDPVITTGAEVNSIFLRKYHRHTLRQCADSLDSVKLNERDISSLTMSVSRKTFRDIKTEIQEFRKRLLAMAKQDANPELVCFTGFQLIPRSEIIDKTETNRAVNHE